MDEQRFDLGNEPVVVRHLQSDDESASVRTDHGVE
jgi:hypothetical protein